MKKSSKLPPDLLKKEIEMQTAALNRISTWISVLLVASTIGIVVIYLGVSSNPRNLWLIVLGAILTILGAGLAILLGYGHRNGKRNVEKMINALEQELNKKQSGKNQN